MKNCIKPMTNNINSRKKIKTTKMEYVWYIKMCNLD